MRGMGGCRVFANEYSCAHHIISHHIYNKRDWQQLDERKTPLSPFPTLSSPMLWIRIRFSADQDPALQVNVDQDPSALKREHREMKFLHLLNFFSHFALLDPNPDPADQN
jgi:hypothetical protein